MKYIIFVITLLISMCFSQKTTDMPSISPTEFPAPTMPTMTTKKPTKSPGYVLPPYMQSYPNL